MHVISDKDTVETYYINDSGVFSDAAGNETIKPIQSIGSAWDPNNDPTVSNDGAYTAFTNASSADSITIGGNEYYFVGDYYGDVTSFEVQPDGTLQVVDVVTDNASLFLDHGGAQGAAGEVDGIRELVAIETGSGHYLYAAGEGKGVSVAEIQSDGSLVFDPALNVADTSGTNDLNLGTVHAMSELSVDGQSFLVVGSGTTGGNYNDSMSAEGG